MATVRFSINPQDPIESVVIAAGAATVTDASSTVSPRAIKRTEVIIALENLIAGLQRDNTTLNI